MFCCLSWFPGEISSQYRHTLQTFSAVGGCSRNFLLKKITCRFLTTYQIEAFKFNVGKFLSFPFLSLICILSIRAPYGVSMATCSSLALLMPDLDGATVEHDSETSLAHLVLPAQGGHVKRHGEFPICRRACSPAGLMDANE